MEKDVITIAPIARIESDFPEKFGIPRQSGLGGGLVSRIVFLSKYRNPDALRGIEGYSHLWIIWGFSANGDREDWSPTVRPPRLGGNERRGVFATRSPNRPNPIGLSSVKLLEIDDDGALLIEDADMMDGTPVYDIKPYLPYVDVHKDAEGGFAERTKDYALTVKYKNDVEKNIPQEKLSGLTAVLAEDPRPSYQEDGRIYKMSFSGLTVEFSVEGVELTVISAVRE